VDELSHTLAVGLLEPGGTGCLLRQGLTGHFGRVGFLCGRCIAGRRGRADRAGQDRSPRWPAGGLRGLAIPFGTVQDGNARACSIPGQSHSRIWLPGAHRGERCAAGDRGIGLWRDLSLHRGAGFPASRSNLESSSGDQQQYRRTGAVSAVQRGTAPLLPRIRASGDRKRSGCLRAGLTGRDGTGRLLPGKHASGHHHRESASGVGMELSRAVWSVQSDILARHTDERVESP